MFRSGHAALAAVAAALCACTSMDPSMGPSRGISATSVERPPVAFAAVAAQAPAAPVFASAFDAMRAALPDFDLQKNESQSPDSEVSVIRDLTFAPDSSILSRADVTRLAPLHAYLRANPLTTVQITGYGDGTTARAREADLSLSRAHAVARALLTDLKVANTIDTAAAPPPRQKQYTGRAEIVFTQPAAPDAQ